MFSSVFPTFFLNTIAVSRKLIDPKSVPYLVRCAEQFVVVFSSFGQIIKHFKYGGK